MRIIEKSLPLPKSSKTLEKMWLELENASKEQSKDSKPQGITWSSRVGRHGFPQRKSFAKTKDNEVILASEASKKKI